MFRRLLIHSVAVGAMSHMIHLHADAMDDVGQRVIEAVSAYLPGGRDRLKTLPAWQLIEKNDSIFDAYFTWLDNVVKFAVAAQAAIDACAAGIVPRAMRKVVFPGQLLFR